MSKTLGRAVPAVVVWSGRLPAALGHRKGQQGVSRAHCQPLAIQPRPVSGHSLLSEELNKSPTGECVDLTVACEATPVSSLPLVLFTGDSNGSLF